MADELTTKTTTTVSETTAELTTAPMGESSTVTAAAISTTNNEFKKQNKNFICGVIEGFYGRPWTTEQRKDLFRKLKRYGMDSYVYAPKDDYKHRAYWRELYTVEEADHLSSLIAAAKEHNIIFYYALSPGLDMIYSNSKEVAILKRKLEQVSQFGCEAFALLFDDIESEMAKADKEVFQTFAHAHVSVTNEIYNHLNCPRFLFCPTQYCVTRAVPTVTNSEYLKTLGAKLAQDIDILWTGSKVISKQLAIEEIEEVTEVLRRAPVIWDNLHANDYDQKRVYLGPYCGRSPEIIPLLHGILTNPNCEYHANTVAINTLAHWSKCNSDTKINTSLSADIKLETENEEGICDEDIPLCLSKNIYHPRLALKNAINDWLPEFFVHKEAWGLISKPHPAAAIVMPVMPIMPSVNTCMSLTTLPTTTSTNTNSSMNVPEVNTTHLQALADVCSNVTGNDSMTLPNVTLNSLVSATKIVTNAAIPNPIVNSLPMPTMLPLSSVGIPMVNLNQDNQFEDEDIDNKNTSNDNNFDIEVSDEKCMSTDTKKIDEPMPLHEHIDKQHHGNDLGNDEDITEQNKNDQQKSEQYEHQNQLQQQEQELGQQQEQEQEQEQQQHYQQQQHEQEQQHYQQEQQEQQQHQHQHQQHQAEEKQEQQQHHEDNNIDLDIKEEINNDIITDDNNKENMNINKHIMNGDGIEDDAGGGGHDDSNDNIDNDEIDSSSNNVTMNIEENSTAQSMEPMECVNSVATSSPKALSKHLDDVVMSESVSTSSTGSMQVENVESSSMSNADMVDDIYKSYDREEKQITAEDLFLFCDLFYLPFEHGSRGLQLINEFYWLKLNAIVLVGSFKKIENGPDAKPEVQEWFQRAEKFFNICQSITTLAKKMAICVNKELCYDLFSYVWDIAGVCILMTAYIKWLTLGYFPSNINAFTQGSYTWFSRGWRETFESGDQEPWVFRGGLIADLQRLIPVDSGNDLFIYKFPDIPTTNFYSIRPYSHLDESDMYAICFKTMNDGCDTCQIFPNDLKNLPGDRYVGAFTTLYPELTFVLQNEDNSVAGFACAALDSKLFYRNQEMCWIPEMCIKYPLNIFDIADNNLSDVAKETIKYFHNFTCDVPADLLNTHPSKLYCCILKDQLNIEQCMAKRIITVLLAALRSNGSFGVHVCIHLGDAYMYQFYSKLGFVDIYHENDIVFLGRNF